MKIGIFVTHPIQYFAPMWRQLAAAPDVDLMVHFFSDHSVRGGVDSGFGVPVAWDVPLLEGYAHRFITRDADLSRPGKVRLPDPRRLLADGNFNAIMFQGYTHGFERQLRKAARPMGIKTLMRGEYTDAEPEFPRSRFKRWARDQYLRRFYSGVDAFCYIGQPSREHLLRLGVAPNRMFFSPYSVDTAHFASQRQRFDRATVRRELGIPDECAVILFSGKLIPRKAPLLLVEAVARLKDPSRVRLIMIGDGEQRQQVEARGREALGSRLIMPGFVNQSELGRYFVAADVFVLPSVFETWGLVVNEAMECGLPVVVSNRVGCARDLVIEGKTGLTFTSGESTELARQIEKLTTSPTARQQMGQAALELIANYSSERSAEGMKKAFDSLALLK